MAKCMCCNRLSEALYRTKVGFLCSDCYNHARQWPKAVFKTCMEENGCKSCFFTLLPPEVRDNFRCRRNKLPWMVAWNQWSTTAEEGATRDSRTYVMSDGICIWSEVEGR